MFSENLKILRKKYGITQEQLAEKTDVSRQAVTKWESGASLPDIENLKTIANIFAISVDELLGDETGVKGNSLEKNLNFMIVYLFTVGIVIFFGVLLVPILNNLNIKYIIAFLCVILFPSIGLWIKNYILETKYVREDDKFKQRKIILSTMPKDFVGRPLDISSSKESRTKRIKFSLLDSFIVVNIWFIIDLISGINDLSFSIKDCLIEMVITFVIFVLVDYIVMEYKVNKYNKIK